MNVMENQSEVLLKRMADMEAKMDERIEGIKLEVNKTTEQIKVAERKTSDMEMDLREENKRLQDQLIMMDCKLLDN